MMKGKVLLRFGPLKITSFRDDDDEPTLFEKIFTCGGKESVLLCSGDGCDLASPQGQAGY